MTTGSTYKVVELVGTSSEGIDQAIEGLSPGLDKH